MARLASSHSPQPRAGPPSPRPSRSASVVARPRLRGLPHAPQTQPCLTALFPVNAVSHTRPNRSRVSLQRPDCRGTPTIPRSLSFSVCLFLVVDRHDDRVTACVHRRNTGRTRPRFVARLARSETPPREGLARVRVRPRRGRRAALARWQGRVSPVSHTRANHSPVHSPVSRLRGLPHETQSKPCFFTTTSLSESSYSPAVMLSFWFVSFWFSTVMTSA